MLLPAVLGFGCGRDALERIRPDGVGANTSDGSSQDGDAAGGDAGDTRAPTIQSISIDPTAATLVRGSTQALVVTAVYFDATTGPVTAQATFTTSDSTIATVNGGGVVTAVARGTATITATVGVLSVTAGVTGSASVIVVAATLGAITVTPANATTTVLLRSSYTATGSHSDGRTVDLTTDVTWWQRGDRRDQH